MLKIFGLLAFFLLFCPLVQGQHAGRYTDGANFSVYFEETQYGLTIRPAIWTATQLLRETGKDKFVVVDRSTRGADFVRDKDGQVTGVVIRGMDGEGLDLRRADGPMIPLELLLAGRTKDAAAGYLSRGISQKPIDDAEQVMRWPTKTRNVVAFLRELAPHFPTDARFHTVFGYALVKAGDRQAALKSFKTAFELDPKNERAISGLARLGEIPPGVSGESWQVPFPLASVFAIPTAAEIAAVEKDWETRDLRPTAIKDELRSTVRIADKDFNLRIVSHLVLGKRHFGAIISPIKPTASKSLGVIVEAKGVSPTYFPLELEKLHSPRMMGQLADRFVYVVPTFRGEVLKFGEKTFTSEGDRVDAFDGAIDDTIALLSVALQVTPEADPNRIVAFGHSRGGSVAMLTGIRDRRVKAVVNWAGPTDWFHAMGTNGWTEQELWTEGLRNRSNPQQVGGQNIERFLLRAIKGEATLKDVRHRMIASSPLYFAYRMPPSQHHYGEEDPSVPVRNGLLLARELVGPETKYFGGKLPSGCDLGARYQIFVYPRQGHDTDRIRAPVYSRKFISRVLASK